MKTHYIKNAYTNEPYLSSNFPRLLLIEDDVTLCVILKDLFDDIGFNCRVLYTTDDIQKEIASFNPDLIMLDYLLPAANGGLLCQEIKKNAKTTKIPVILLSAYPNILISISEYGCDAFIAKPFSISDLLQPIMRLLNVKGKFE